MSEVLGVEENYIPAVEVGFLSSESTEQSEKAVTDYQDPGVNSGWSRMKEEGVMMETTSPEIRAAKQKLALAIKLKDLEPLITNRLVPYSEVGSLIARLVGPYDHSLAQSYIDRLNGNDWTKAMIELSKNLPPDKAQLLLNQIKQEFGYLTKDLILVYREEARRGLEGKERTFQLLEKVCFKCYPREFAELLIDFQLEIPSGFLKGMHEENIRLFLQSDVQPSIKQYWLLNLLKVEARAESPFVFETLELLRANTEEVRAQFLNDKRFASCPEYPVVNYIHNWMNIIEVEATTPLLSFELDKDFSFLIKTFKELKQQNPEDTEDFDFALSEKIGQLVTDYPSKVSEILDVVEDRDTALVSLIKAGHPNKYQFLQELVQKGEEEEHGPSFYIDLFSCVVLLKGIDQALPYLEKAKLEIDDEDWEDLADILKIELTYRLPSAHQTLEKLHEILDKKTNVFSDVLMLVIEAELSLLIDSF